MADLCTSPAKLLKHGRHLVACQNGPVWPPHVSICCTSRCPLDCSFCVVRNRQRNIDLDPAEHDAAIIRLAAHGLGAVQYSGGEPLAWPHIDQALELARDLHLSVGLQTNGLLLEEHADFLGIPKWIRVGIYDREQTGLPAFNLDAIPQGVNVQITTVWHDGLDDDFLPWYADFGRRNRVLAARVVLDVNSTNGVEAAMAAVDAIGHPLVFQDRKRTAASACHMAWWKTAIDWHGFFYACGCFGLQDKGGELPKRLRVGHISDMAQFYNSVAPHDMGHRCDPCPYAAHNDILSVAMLPVDDPEFL